MFRYRKILLAFCILSIPGLYCTSYQGLSKDDFQKNPYNYAIITDGNCIGCGNTGLDEVDDIRLVTADTVVVNPGNHKIKIGILPYNDPLYYATFNMTCKAGMKYYIDAEFNSDTQAVSVRIREEPIAKGD